MKRILVLLLMTWLALPAGADLTVTVVPGYAFGPGEAPTTDHLNQLGTPTVSVTGTLDGSTSLAAGSVNGTLLADTVPDGVTLNYNSSVPRSLQVLSAGLVGPGLTNTGTSTLGLSIDPSLQITTLTNTGGSAYTVAGVSPTWLKNFLWTPWALTPWATNATYYGTNNAWGFTNVTAVTNLYFGSNAMPALTATDTVPVMVSRQGNNPQGIPLGVIEKFITTANLKQVATLSLLNSNYSGATLVTNEVILQSLVLTDSAGTNALIDPGNPLVINDPAVTNSTPLTAVLTNIANRINTTAGVPQFFATVSGTNLLIWEPLLFYPRATCTLVAGVASSLVTNIIIGSPTNTTLIYTNLQMRGTSTFNTAFYGGGKSGFLSGFSIVQSQVFLNTNLYPELVTFSGTISNAASAPITGWIGDAATNIVASFGTNTTATMTIPAQSAVLPPQYGIYISGAGYSFTASRIPYH